MTDDQPPTDDEFALAREIAGADDATLRRTLRRLAGMHSPGPTGRCPWCQPPLRWRRRRSIESCRTTVVLTAELRTGAVSPNWLST